MAQPVPSSPASSVAGEDDQTTEFNPQETPKLNLLPGQMKSYSHHIPSLKAGPYNVQVAHELSSSGESPLRLASAQRFTVVVPRFSLPHGDIHSCYPHHGHAEMAHVLPHTVFNDPHLPWERWVETNEHDPRASVCTPWLGILTFTPEELKIDPKDWPAEARPLKQSALLSSGMSLESLYRTSAKVALPFSAQELVQNDSERPPGEKRGDMVKAIFLKSALFQDLFCQQTGPPNVVSLDRYKYMAHVRCVQRNDETKEFSVVVSPRSGPTDLDSPKPMIAHLVSLEGIEENIKFPLPVDKPLVGLISLHSWSYQSLPPGHIDYVHLMKELGLKMAPLRYSDSIIEMSTGLSASHADHKTGAPTSDMESRQLNISEKKWLQGRMLNGFSFVRYRPNSGEETTALYRGPVSPDLSYNLARELGRSLAYADRAFLAAMTRIRGQVHKRAQGNVAAQLSVLNPNVRSYVDKSTLLSALKDNIMTDDDNAMNKMAPGESTERRWRAPTGRGGTMVKLSRAPDLSVLLVGASINQIPCKMARARCLETYFSWKGEGGNKIQDEFEIQTDVPVEKELSQM
ncbi:MAG: hypothetical protein MMC33_005688 [Icmadophila ericetorum]|nr:hypothetical protein [Icmadophila ericetorum]